VAHLGSDFRCFELGGNLRAKYLADGVECVDWVKHGEYEFV